VRIEISTLKPEVERLDGYRGKSGEGKEKGNEREKINLIVCSLFSLPF
jgi:hypothetical protein